jgi:hypothetical protein
MTKRAGMLITNIIASVLLAISMSWAALFAFCQYSPYNAFCNRSDAYAIIAGLAAALSLTTFLLHQHANAHAMMQRKRGRPLPHVINRYATVEKNVSAIWNVWNNDEKIVKSIPIDDMEDYGWVVEFVDAYPVIVSQKEFYYWLLTVVQLQQRLGNRTVSSPLGLRNNPDLSRKRLDAYISLLESINAIEYVNANVKRLKPIAARDVWMNVIKPLEKQKPVVRI